MAYAGQALTCGGSLLILSHYILPKTACCLVMSLQRVLAGNVCRAVIRFADKAVIPLTRLDSVHTSGGAPYRRRYISSIHSGNVPGQATVLSPVCQATITLFPEVTRSTPSRWSASCCSRQYRGSSTPALIHCGPVMAVCSNQGDMRWSSTSCAKIIIDCDFPGLCLCQRNPKYQYR